jgi:hypothetical protein
MHTNIQATLLPHKHVRFSNSLVAIAGFVRKQLTEPRTVDELWALVNRDSADWPTRPSFTQLVLAINILFVINQVEAGPDGRICHIEHKTPLIVDPKQK